MNKFLVIEGLAVRRDNDCRYCLNDLNRTAIVSGLNAKTKEPGKFLTNTVIGELVQELTVTQNMGIAPVSTIRGGQYLESYFCKKLVYDYPKRVDPTLSRKEQSHFLY
ncbi:KilA-N domain-containing protein [Rosenbergiella australiborealis]|uniref:KilA-N domain-containing protein n=1 Tax=Rosenbergiella australiborealis TaxID=1544696 RepID=UPI001F4DC746|nr:KilA-N domain-containing protein [Rosenbergiella australiborealis]